MSEVFSNWDDRRAADDLLRSALEEALASFGERDAPWASRREEELRTGLFEALARRLPGHVRRERKLAVAAFRGVGPSDLLVDRTRGGPVAWLAETKWSYTAPPKVFECVWDAIKLCLQVREHQVARAWVIAAASDAAWQTTEARDLFVSGEADTLTLWNEPLDPPRSPNFGSTVGEDLVSGGRSNRPSSVPRTITTDVVAEIPLTGVEPWTVRAVAVSPSGGWIDDFSPPPKFPSPMTQRWLAANAPSMDEATFEELLSYLRAKRWSERELSDRVFPLRHQPSDVEGDWRQRFPDATEVVKAEGGAVYTALRDGAWWIIRDESTAVELLEEVDASDLSQEAVTIERFADADSWRAAVVAAIARAEGRPPPARAPHRLPNEELTEAHLPPPAAPWGQISGFAASFSGYAEHGGLHGLAAFARAMRTRYEDAGELPKDLSDLRSALFYEQRSDRFSDSADEALPYIHALVEAIRSVLRRPS